jgi:ubiquinol-cytochrome c reductase cytochrome b subunit
VSAVESPTAEPSAPERTRRQRIFGAIDERLGLSGLQYPVPEHANKLAYSLGGLTLITFILMVITGVYLTQFYNPTIGGAHASVRSIITSVSFGKFVRGFHYWGAMAMIVLIGLHLLRVFVSGAFKRPREFNWVVGVVLAGITATLFFTGTVLKWDQESLEALEHNIEVGKILGKFGFWFSPSFGGVSILTRLYVVHIAVLPLLFVLVVAVHMLLVKRHLAELGALGLVLTGILTVLAVLAPPPHGPAPVAGIEVTKPPWPMLWIYPVEDWVGVSGILWATMAIFLALFLGPVVDRGPERDPRKRIPMMIAAGVVVLTIIAFIIYAAVQPVASHIGMGG